MQASPTRIGSTLTPRVGVPLHPESEMTLARSGSLGIGEQSSGVTAGPRVMRLVIVIVLVAVSSPDSSLCLHTILVVVA